MYKSRVLLVVSIATLLVMFSLSLPALAKPECTCIQAEATRTGNITYTIVITADNSLWYDVVESISGDRVVAPSRSNVFTDVVLQGGHTYNARVSDSRKGSYSSSDGCTISLSPTAVEITSLKASSNPSVAILMALVVTTVMVAAVYVRRK